ncbi:MAG: hypothetical protein KAT65_19135, partial [Methanophagales archaeon]|nr:hypothetical protein [Methanophagales archaeon]
QDIPVGTVTVSHDGTYITITYTTTDDCVLNATHLDVATSLDAIHQTKKNNPIPGQFEYSAVHVPPENTMYTYTTIPFPTSDTTLYIAAHAKVSCLEDGVYVQEKTAWAGTEVGQMPFAGSNWATYFTIEILYSENKDPGDWQPIIDEMSGILGYNPSGPTFDFFFYGQGLELITDYSLIYYADYNRTSSPHLWGGDNPGALIATGTSNDQGEIHLADSKELGMDLPCSPDWNINPDPDYCDNHNEFDDYDHCSGAKIWLVLSDDYDGIDTMTGWNPTKYLFETDLIWYDDTEVDTCGWP